ncbi:MAG: MoaD/ThiS family protein [Peptococcaceae bacterium]|nr:MoaD/ThiS family protein [Peptococcaceae bacterium]
MSIQVNFMSLISSTAGVRRVRLDPAYRTLGEVLDDLTRLYPGLKEELFDEEGRLDYLYQIFLNGEKLEWSSARDEPVRDGDQLAIFAVIGGG